MNAIIKRTTKEDQRIALTSIPFLSKELKKNTVRLEIQETGQLISIPKKAFSLLVEIVSNMAEGKSIALIPSDSELSTQQAADILNVSRPHLVKLLEDKKIPFRKVGSHRRVHLKDIMKYDKEFKENRRKQLQFLADEAQELNLGY